MPRASRRAVRWSRGFAAGVGASRCRQMLLAQTDLDEREPVQGATCRRRAAPGGRVHGRSSRVWNKWARFGGTQRSYQVGRCAQVRSAPRRADGCAHFLRQKIRFLRQNVRLDSGRRQWSSARPLCRGTVRECLRAARKGGIARDPSPRIELSRLSVSDTRESRFEVPGRCLTCSRASGKREAPSFPRRSPPRARVHLCRTKSTAIPRITAANAIIDHTGAPATSLKSHGVEYSWRRDARSDFVFPVCQNFFPIRITYVRARACDDA